MEGGRTRIEEVDKTLGEGKSYHAFISYHPGLDDFKFVSELRIRFEKRKYKVFYLHEEQKFDLTVKQNIEKAIESSLKTVIVVSKSYLACKGCQSEFGIILKRFHKPGCKKFVIPLFVDELSRLPDEVRHIQGIKTNNNPNWFEEVEKLFSENKEPQEIATSFPYLQVSKKYNVFFSYKTVSPDKEWVRQVVESLEASSPKVVCAYHERDFETGRSIIENIKYCIENSEKVIIVLSEEFLRSEWTQYETEIAQYRSISKPNDLVIIPVLLSDCAIPARLATITYLDATEDQSVWWEKLLKTVNSPNSDIKLRTLSKNEEIQTLKMSTFNGRLEQDSHESWLIDIEFTQNHTIVVTDAKNLQLKRFSLKGVFEDHIKFASRPMFMCMFDDGAAFVTFPDEEVLRVVDTDKDMLLTYVNEIHVPKQCSGIATVGQDKFAVCLRSEGEIRIMHRSGELLRTVCPEIGVNEICQCPSSSTKDSETIYDTDEECESSKSATDKGRKDFAFYRKHRESISKEKRLVMPGHMTSSKDGRQLFVTDYDTKFLTAISFAGSDFSHQSVSLTEPRGVAVNEERLFVAAGHVRLFDTNTDEHGEIPLHGGPVTFPRGLAIDYMTRYLAVTHKGDGGDRISVYQLLPRL